MGDVDGLEPAGLCRGDSEVAESDGENERGTSYCWGEAAAGTGGREDRTCFWGVAS